MKNIVACIALLAIACIPASAQTISRAKLSPFTRIYLWNVEKSGSNKTMLPGYVYKTIGNKKYVSALIKVTDQVSVSSLNDIGVLIGTKAGKIWTAQIPVEQVGAFALVPGIEYIELNEPMASTLDSVRVATHVDSVHAGIGLSMPYTGKNVVVGVIDAGFDYHHPSFFDTTGTAFRIKRIWEQKTVGTAPTGFAYGNEITDSNAMWTAGTDNHTFSHGSHVAGIAGGSGFGSDASNTRFRGMAYESDLAFVGIMPDPNEWVATGVSDVIDGINYLYTYAASVGKPCVANLSWGTTIGPHDGNSLFSQACDNLTGPGKIFVLAAGNNGGSYVHLQKTYTNADTLVNTQVGFDPALGAKKTWVDIWGEAGKSFCVKITLYNNFTPGVSTGFICLDDNVHDFQLIGAGNDTCFVTMTTDASDFNGKPRVFLNIYSKVSNRVVLSVKGTDGTVNMWAGYVQNGHGYYGGFSTFANLAAGMNGDGNYTVGDIACTKSAVTVAAYTTKNIYTGLNNATTNYTTYATRGAIAPFSSIGPTMDGRTKPDIAAPGLIIGSAVNSYDTTYSTTGPYYSDVVGQYHNPQNNRDYAYGMMMGTSMASPAACGIIALMLQANPQLSPGAVQAILYATAIKDSFTGAIPVSGSTIWGGGKINAYRAVLDAVNHTTGVSSTSAGNALPCMLYPNPNAGNFTIGYYSECAETVKVQVQDIAGKIVMTTKWNVNTGYNTKQLNLSGTAKGIYFTKLSTTSGSRTIKTVIE